MSNDDIEIKSAERTIELLEQYKSATTQEQRDILLKQMDEVDGFANRFLSQKKITPDELITKITKAISLNRYRPKNLSITLFAVNEDLDYINGEFDTFDRELSQMLKNNENPEKIRNKFKVGTVNIYKLAKNFSAEWVHRLKEHKELADAARNAKEDTAVKAYNELFNALAKDFCEEYNCHIHAKVITDWATSDVKPKDGWDNTDGYCYPAYGLVLPENISKEEKTKILEEFRKNPVKYPGAYRESLVRINITNVRNRYSEPVNFFYKMISIFAHEMHHALDYQQSRKGALGPQIYEADQKTYTPPTESINAYLDSATEISSHIIEDELFNQLKSISF